MFPSQLASHLKSIICWSVLPSPVKEDFAVTLLWGLQWCSYKPSRHMSLILQQLLCVFTCISRLCSHISCECVVHECSLDPGLIFPEGLLVTGHCPLAWTLTHCTSFCHQPADPGWLCCPFAVLALTHLPSLSSPSFTSHYAIKSYKNIKSIKSYKDMV